MYQKLYFRKYNATIEIEKIRKKFVNLNWNAQKTKVQQFCKIDCKATQIYFMLKI